MWTVITATQHDRWMACLERMGRYDIYHLPAYHRAYEVGTKARSHAYIAEVGGEMLFHPVMLRPIDRVGDAPAPQGLCDAETVYGYSGPLATTKDPGFLTEAWRGYPEWCRERNVVCEFTRFNPMLRNQVFAAPECETWLDRRTVTIDLSGGEEAVWRGYASVHRNRIRKAIKNGLVCERRPVPEGIPAFHTIYQETMRNLDAGAFYHFSQDHLSKLSEGLDAQCLLFMVSVNGTDIAGALLLAHGDTLHYHLPGSIRAQRHLAPNNLLIHEASRWAIGRGLKSFHLGGGRGPADDDSLFRFKANFSATRGDMWFGKQVFDPAAYESLVSRWLEQSQGQERPPYFQLYRIGQEDRVQPADTRP